MKMPNRNISKATTNKGYNTVLQAPYLDIDNSIIVATTGHILAACPVELDDEDTSGPVSNEAIKAALKASPVKSRSAKTANIKANGALVLDNGATYPREDIGKFPQYERVIPDKDKAEMVVSFDAKLLKDLADAINTPGSSIVTLHIADKDSAMFVDSDDLSECYGVIMPCRIK